MRHAAHCRRFTASRTASVCGQSAIFDNLSTPFSLVPLFFPFLSSRHSRRYVIRTLPSIAIDGPNGMAQEYGWSNTDRGTVDIVFFLFFSSRDRSHHENAPLLSLVVLTRTCVSVSVLAPPKGKVLSAFFYGYCALQW